MAGTKAYYDQILENQNKLMTTLTEYAVEAVETMMPDETFGEKVNKLVQEYLSRPYEIAEEITKKENAEKYQKDFWTTYTQDMNRNLEASMELYRKSTDFFREMWTKNVLGDQQGKMKKYLEIVQNSMKAYTDAVNANAKLIQSYFSNN